MIRRKRINNTTRAEFSNNDGFEIGLGWEKMCSKLELLRTILDKQTNKRTRARVYEKNSQGVKAQVRPVLLQSRCFSRPKLVLSDFLVFQMLWGLSHKCIFLVVLDFHPPLPPAQTKDCKIRQINVLENLFPSAFPSALIRQIRSYGLC